MSPGLAKKRERAQSKGKIFSTLHPRRLDFQGDSRRRALRLALGASALGLVMAPVAASAATTPQKQLTLLQQGLNFYKGKTITLISPDAVGGGFDVMARAVAPTMAAYLHATINIQNDSPANTVAGQDLMEASPADGLTIGMVNAGSDIEDIVTGTPGVNFNPAKLQYLGGNNPNAGQGFECLSSSGITNFAQVVHSTSPVSEVIVSTGTQTLLLDLENAAFNLKTKIIGGYTNTAAQVAGQERGDGQCSVMGIGTAGYGPYIAAGKANLLLDDFPPNPATAFYQYSTKALSLTQAYKEFPSKTKTETLARAALVAVAGHGVGHEFNAPARTPAAQVAALRAAVQKALTTQSVENRLLAQGQQNGWVTGPRAQQAYVSELASLKPLSSLIKSALGV